jgi:hypothetical protein
LLRERIILPDDGEILARFAEFCDLLKAGEVACQRARRRGDDDDLLADDEWGLAYALAEVIADIPAASVLGFAVKVYIMLFVADAGHDDANGALGSNLMACWPGEIGIVRDLVRFAPQLAPRCAARLDAAACECSPLTALDDELRTILTKHRGRRRRR